MTISINKAPLAFVFAVALSMFMLGCYSPIESQDYFRQATLDDPALEPMYSTTLYTVYFDHALRRCIIHSSYSWGERGGGGGGTGIGIEAFRCDPNRIRARAREAGLKVYRPKRDLVIPNTTPKNGEPNVQ